MEPLPQLPGFKTLQHVGSGARGRVYAAHRLTASGAVDHAAPLSVLKVVRFDQADEDAEGIMAEVSAMAVMRHPNMVQYRGAFIAPHDPALCVEEEFIDGGSLREVYEQAPGAFTEEVISAVAVDLLHALRYLHDRCHVVHRDVKSANILLSRGGVTKLGDLGACAAMEGTQSRHTVVGTPGWMAPEVVARLKGVAPPNAQAAAALQHFHDAGLFDEHSAGAALRQGYGYTSDVWSLGATLLELCLGSVPTDAAITQLRSHRRGDHPCPPSAEPLFERFSMPFIDFAVDLLDPDPDTRPTAAMLLDEHPYVQDAAQLFCAPDDPMDDGEASPLLAGAEAASLGVRCCGKGRAVLRAVVARLPQTVVTGDPGAGPSASPSVGPAADAAAADPAAAAEAPPRGAALDRTRWNMVHPNLASMLDGTQPYEWLGGGDFMDTKESVVARVSDTALDAAPRELPAPSGNPAAVGADTFQSTAFGPLFHHVLLPSLYATARPGVRPDTTRFADDTRHRARVVARIARHLHECEACMPGFSSAFLRSTVHTAIADPVVAPALQHSLARGAAGHTQHLDGQVSLSCPTHPSRMGASSARYGPVPLAAVQAPVVPLAHRPVLRDPVGAMEQLIVETKLPVNYPPQGPGWPHGAGEPDPSSDVCALLYERWKGDVSRARRTQLM